MKKVGAPYLFLKGWKTMILITGGNGQLGTELRHLLDEQGTDYVATDVKELDITDEKATMEYITKMQPTLICQGQLKIVGFRQDKNVGFRQ